MELESVRQLLRDSGSEAPSPSRPSAEPAESESYHFL